MSAKPEGSRLAGRRILLGVTGGIAAYKAAELVRRLKEQGADVQVIMTASAQKFVAALTFQALSGRPVRTTLWDEAAEAAMGHIELARWADAIVVAPASANFVARLAQGRGDDLLATVCLAADRPLLLAPAMNQQMWAHRGTQDNLALLKKRGVRVLGPAEGDQACGEIGPGRMLEPEQLRDTVIGLFESGPLAGVAVTVTAGPTREPVDPVRVLTNRSSGKMGFAVASALAGLGARVTLIAGPVHLPTPGGVRRVDVETAQEMLEASLEAVDRTGIFVGAAAVADYRPAAPPARKIKKKTATAQLKLARTDDILVTLRAKHPKLFLVGFAAETDDVEDNARKKLRRKKLDMIAANRVGNGRAFDRDDNELQVYWKNGGQALGQAPKADLARRLADLIASHYRKR